MRTRERARHVHDTAAASAHEADPGRHVLDGNGAVGPAAESPVTTGHLRRVFLGPRIPRLRRLASARVRPHLVQIWADVKVIATEPRKIFYVLTGSVLSQLFVALALGASLHAVGEQESLATLLVVITAASIIGGAVPVPGGLGVVEAGLIAGLTSAGVPQAQAVAAVFIQRLFTAYLPPIWGWFTLAWMRRREYV